MASKDGATGRVRATTDQLGIDGYGAAVVIGQGAFGVAYRARDRARRRTVAIKVLTAAILDDSTLFRFDRQRAALRALSAHPNIVAVHGSGLTTSGVPYVVMEYMARGSLADELERLGPVDWRQVVAWGIKVAGALESAHRVGVVHGDIKTENVLLSDYGEPKLADFGSAEIVDGRRPTVAADVYALASTLMALMLGRPPEQGDTVEGLPASLAAVFEKAAADEFLSALSLGRALQHVEEERGLARTELPVDVLPPVGPADLPEAEPLVRAVAERTSPAPPAAPPTPRRVPTPTAPPPPPSPRPPRRWARPVLNVGVLLVLVAVIAIVVANNSQHTPSAPPAAVPPVGSHLAPGAYATADFQPSLTFRLDDGWTVSSGDSANRLELTRTDTPGAVLGFHIVDQVIDPSTAPTRGQDVDPTVRSLPSDVTGWLRDNPRLHVTASGKANIARGATFVEFTVADGYKFNNGNPANPCATGSCVMLFRTEDIAPTLVGAIGGDKLRFYLVPQRNIRLMVVTVSAPAAEYAAFSPEAQKVLSTLKIGSS